MGLPAYGTIAGPTGWAGAASPGPAAPRQRRATPRSSESTIRATGTPRDGSGPGHAECPARAAGLPVRASPSPCRRSPSSSLATPPPCCGSRGGFRAAAAAAPGPGCPFPSRGPSAAPAARRHRGRPGRRSTASEPRQVTDRVQWAPDMDPRWAEDQTDLAAFRPIAGTEVILALMPMSVLKALVGFTTFLFAFGLRRAGPPPGGSDSYSGALRPVRWSASLLVAWIRRALQRAADADRLTVAGGRRHHRRRLLTSWWSRRWWPSRSALAGALAEPSFDALVQHHVRESTRDVPSPASRRVPAHVGDRFVRSGGAVAAGIGGQPGHGRERARRRRGRLHELPPAVRVG